MRLDVARQLKTEMLVKARGALVRRFAIRERTARTARPPARRRGGGRGAGPARRRASPRAAPRRPAVAFGVAPGATSRDYKLAVRVMSRDRGVVRDVMETVKDVPASERDYCRVRYKTRRALRAGGSCGHFNISAGTLGAFVEDADAYYILSNNHVLADSDRGSKGDAIWEPGPVDVVRGRFREIGHLERWVRLNRRTRTNLDAAIARIADTIDDFYPWHYTGVGEIDPRPVTDRFSVHEVVKRGATTNVTRGHVSAFDLDGIELDYTTPRGTETITFNNLLEFTHRRPTRWDFSAGGDSGSLIIDEETMRPYALLIGGGPDDDGIDRTLGHFIPEVLDRLGVSFVR